MKTQYYLSQLGRELCPLDGDAKECLAQVREIAKQELKRCKARFGSATLHRPTDKAWRVTIGKDFNSSIWTSVSLTY